MALLFTLLAVLVYQQATLGEIQRDAERDSRRQDYDLCVKSNNNALGNRQVLNLFVPDTASPERVKLKQEAFQFWKVEDCRKFL